MSEFIRHLLTIGMMSVLALTQGTDSRAPSAFPESNQDTVTAAWQGDAADRRAVDYAAPSGLETPSAQPGATVAQANSAVAQPLKTDRPAGNPSRAQSAGPVLDQPPRRNQLSPDDTPVLNARSPEPGCRLTPTPGYGSINIFGGPSEHPAVVHPDLNLGQRTWRAVSAPLSLVNVGGPTDEGAPRFASLFVPGRMPHLTGAYQVYNWDFRAGRRTTPIMSPAVTLIGFATTPEEMLLLPESGYDIGNGYSALVLYAEPMRLTLKYTREDNVAVGYTLHLENICVDPRLLASYRALDAAGRRQLPAIRTGQPVGSAAGTQLLTGIQDSGSWMDPRSRKDWWQ